MSELDDLKADMDTANLYTETIVTDRKMGAMRVLKPITADGAPDPARKCLFMGEVQIMTQMGPLPISFEIEADTMAEAVAKYGESAKLGVQKTIERLQQMRRDAASKIVTPDSPGFGVPGMGGTGSKIQLS
ncbi:MAG: hypothetical protein ACI4SV_06985 [Duodenibacillus sp.]